MAEAEICTANGNVKTAIQDDGEGVVHLPGESEMIETIDASSCCHNQQEDVIILNLDFEEMAQAVFGQLDLVDQIIAGDGDAHTSLDATDLLVRGSPPKIEDASGSDLEISAYGAGAAPIKPQEQNEKIHEKKSGKIKEKGAGKVKTKGDKSIDHILKALNSLHTTEEKLAALCKKYADLMEEHRNLQITQKQTERRCIQYTKEKEQVQAEHSKAILTRSRLESLCRELQRQNKLVKDESLMRVREEEEKRKEVSAKFQSTFNEISSMMQDNNQKNSKLREENLELAQKLKTLVEQYEMREQQVENLLKHKDMEVQLAEAKLAKANAIMNEEKERYIQEKHKLLLDLTEYQKKCHEMTSKEVKLRTQLNLYSEKYEEFQTTITKSNDVFSHFKDEMDKMSKKIKKLEKETGSWRSKWEGSNKALIEMAADKQRHDAEMCNGQKKIIQLEKLCRALQLERTNLLAQLKGDKDQNNEEGSQSSPPPLSNDEDSRLSLISDQPPNETANESSHNCNKTATSDGVANDESPSQNCDKKRPKNDKSNRNNLKVGKGKKKNKGANV